MSVFSPLIVFNMFLKQRNLKVMISMGLSAKQEKDDRFQQTKKEVVEMIKMRLPSPRSKVDVGLNSSLFVCWAQPVRREQVECWFTEQFDLYQMLCL